VECDGLLPVTEHQEGHPAHGSCGANSVHDGRGMKIIEGLKKAITALKPIHHENFDLTKLEPGNYILVFDERYVSGAQMRSLGMEMGRTVGGTVFVIGTCDIDNTIRIFKVVE